MTRPILPALLARVPAHLHEPLRERTAVGVARYGRALCADNGRDAVRDLREELLDALQYAEQARMEGRLTDAAADAVQAACVEALTRIAWGTLGPRRRRADAREPLARAAAHVHDARDMIDGANEAADTSLALALAAIADADADAGGAR
jgi:hypothetical protein